MSRYPAYKDSGIEWVGEMPEGWQAKPLFAVFKERHVSNDGSRESNVLSLSYGRIIRRDIESNFGLLPESFETYNIVEPSNIVLRLTDLQNDKRSLRCGLVNERGIITSAYLTLEKKSEIDCKYMYYLLHNYDIWKVFYSMGGGVRQSIKFDDLKRLPILLPDLDEQKAIASYLDCKIAQIDDLIAKKERMIELLKEERSVVINQGVTRGIDPNVELKDAGIKGLGRTPKHWGIKKIKFISKVFRGKFTHRPRNDERLYSGKYPFIQTGDVASAGKYVTEYTQTLNELGKSVTAEFPSGTLLMTIAANIGEVAILGFDACFPDSIVGFYPNGLIIRDFLYYKFKAMKEVFLSTSVLNTQMNLNIDRISEVSISFPSLDEQDKIIAFLNGQVAKADGLIAREKKSVELLREFRTALISEAVTGKIDVRTCDEK